MNEPLDTDTQIRVISCIEESGDVSNEQTVRDVSYLKSIYHYLRKKLSQLQQEIMRQIIHLIF